MQSSNRIQESVVRIQLGILNEKADEIFLLRIWRLTERTSHAEVTQIKSAEY
jgi:hypothetical protein